MEKKSLINNLFNYIMNIKYEDDFRYILNKENKILNKKLNEINIYNIKKTQNIPPIKIIDFPIFNQENNTKNKIEYIINNKINNINSICFVIKSNNDKTNIFYNILNLFGYDVIKNFLFIFTNYNNEKPLIFNKFEEKDSIFNRIKNELKEDWYFTFNNSIILNAEKDEISKRIWEMNMNNFEKFIKKIKHLPKINLNITREVIKTKKQILIHLENLNEDFHQILLNKINLEDIIKDIENGMKHSSKTVIYEKIENPNGVYSKYCNRCNYLCEKESNLPLILIFLDILNLSDLYCKKCPLKCHFSEHSYSRYHFEAKEVKKLDKKFIEYHSIMKSLENHIKNKNISFVKTNEELKNMFCQLMHISLNKNFESY